MILLKNFKKVLALLFFTMSLLSCSSSSDGDAKPSALVSTELAEQRQLQESLKIYGVFNPSNNASSSINFPQPVQIIHVLTTVDAFVKQGANLLELSIDPGASLSYRQAVLDRDLATDNLKQVQRLLAAQLATQVQLQSAQRALAGAEAALEIQKEQGNGLNQQNVTAPFDGIVLTLSAKDGDRVPAGTTVLELARLDNLSVQLGAEPQESFKIKQGMPVLLSSVYDKQISFSGLVDNVGSAIDPSSRLIPVVVDISSPQQNAHARYIPGMAVVGEVILKTIKVWAVPRQAVLQDKEGSYIYQIKNTKAHRVNIKTGIQDHSWIAIEGNFEPTEKVVILGNYELEEGMSVQEERAP